MAPLLRLYTGDECDRSAAPCDPEGLKWDRSRLAPVDQPAITSRDRLSRWFTGYWVPLELASGADPARDKTVLGYYEAVRWAIRLAGDPILRDLDDCWVNRVHDGLRTATFGRAAGAAQTPLSAATAAKHRRTLGTMLRELRWGELIPPLRPARRVRRHHARDERQAPRPYYTVEQLRAILRHVERTPIATLAPARAAHAWRVLYGLAFYTGLRRETVLALDWIHVQQGDAGQMQLHVPAELTKDGEPWDGPLHPALAVELHALHGATRSGTLAIWPYAPDWWYRRHRAAVRAAGVDGDRGRDLHGIRRTHAVELATLGFQDDLRGLAALMNHSDSQITTRYYVQLSQVRARYLPRLPAIW